MSKRMEEARELATKILEDIEDERLSLSNIARKGARLAVLLGDDATRSKLHEAVRAIPLIENDLESAEQSRDHASKDKNPFDYPSFYQGAIIQSKNQLASWRTFLYEYATGVYHELLFSEAAMDVFGSLRRRNDLRITRLLPDAAQHLSSVYENLQSTNPEDWANAVHSCRRLLKRLADHLLPASDDPRLTDEKFVNRLVTWISKRSESETFSKVVGSHLDYIGHRIAAVYKASTKGSHDKVTREEAERYVAYTYLLVGDILELAEENQAG